MQQNFFMYRIYSSESTSLGCKERNQLVIYSQKYMSGSFITNFNVSYPYIQVIFSTPGKSIEE